MIQVFLCILILISLIIYNNVGLEQIEKFEATTKTGADSHDIIFAYEDGTTHIQYADGWQTITPPDISKTYNISSIDLNFGYGIGPMKITMYIYDNINIINNEEDPNNLFDKIIPRIQKELTVDPSAAQDDSKWISFKFDTPIDQTGTLYLRIKAHEDSTNNINIVKYNTDQDDLPNGGTIGTINSKGTLNHKVYGSETTAAQTTAAQTTAAQTTAVATTERPDPELVGGLSSQSNECNFDYTQKNYMTKNNCVRDCVVINGCVGSVCQTKCGAITKIEEQKRLNDLTKSDSANIRAFSGNKGIKLTWVKPRTLFDIEKYYIVLSSKINNLLEVYILDDNSQLIDYNITGLDNGVIYEVFVIVKNKMNAISDPSNTESILTRKESKLDLSRTDVGVGDSMGARSIPNKSIRYQQPLYNKHIVYNDIIDILNKNLGFKPPSGIYNINIY